MRLIGGVIESYQSQTHLVTALVADDNKHGAMLQLDAILHQCAYAGIHLLSHGCVRRPRSGRVYN
jgi:hypothetical protein